MYDLLRTMPSRMLANGSRSGADTLTNAMFGLVEVRFVVFPFRWTPDRAAFKIPKPWYWR